MAVYGDAKTDRLLYDPIRIGGRRIVAHPILIHEHPGDIGRDLPQHGRPTMLNFPGK